MTDARLKMSMHERSKAEFEYTGENFGSKCVDSVWHLYTERTHHTEDTDIFGCTNCRRKLPCDTCTMLYIVEKRGAFSNSDADYQINATINRWIFDRAKEAIEFFNKMSGENIPFYHIELKGE